MNGHVSRLFCINAASIPGPRLIRMFINNLPDVMSSQRCIYADDTTIDSCLNSKIDSSHTVKLSVALENERQSFVKWGLRILTPPKEIYFDRKKEPFLSVVMAQ